MRRAVLTLTATAAALGAPAAASAGPLVGRTMVINPGHNGGNVRAPATINRTAAIGQGRRKACDTTGTATDGGYTKAAYAWRAQAAGGIPAGIQRFVLR